MKNEYYSIALGDLEYLQATLHLPYYNNIAIAAQQVAEKMLKSVVELSSVNCESLLRSHNLRALYDEAFKQFSVSPVNRGDLSMLKDYYFDAKYPGDNFVNVTEAECEQCLTTMYDVIEFVHAARNKLGLDCVQVDRKLLKFSHSTAKLSVF